MKNEPRIIKLPKINDPRGNLTYIESENHLPFEIKRAFWIYDVPGGEVRGGHAKKQLEEFIVALTGSFDVSVDDGMNKITYTLNRSYYGLYIPNLYWRELSNFSTNSVALYLVSRSYEKDDYIYHYEDFRKLKDGI
ncbi:MAG: WxcM-like domain-containing protein [Melioribacteraceae bacterium]|nr:WxcM-like domain-containing protein [Melioribacteraceae bacterium]